MGRLNGKRVILMLLLWTCSIKPQVLNDKDKSIEYRVGTANIILTAPHGGYKLPSSIPDRKPGCWINSSCQWQHNCGTTSSSRCQVRTRRDMFTKEITLAVAEEIEAKLGKSPHVIINHLHRSKLDANRDIGEAALGVSRAEEAWHSFQSYIDMAKQTINAPGLLLDFHGQTHQENWIELGYLISKSKLNSGTLTSADSSIYSLAGNVPMTFEQLLRGNSSFGTYISQFGYKVVPSKLIQSPGSGNYYSGGFITKRHGSRDSGMIDAIKIEAPRSLRTNDKVKTFAKNLATAIVGFVQKHYSRIKI